MNKAAESNLAETLRLTSMTGKAGASISHYNKVKRLNSSETAHLLQPQPSPCSLYNVFTACLFHSICQVCYLFIIFEYHAYLLSCKWLNEKILLSDVGEEQMFSSNCQNGHG